MKDEYEKCASYKMQIENVVRLKKLKKKQQACPSQVLRRPNDASLNRIFHHVKQK